MLLPGSSMEVASIGPVVHNLFVELKDHGRTKSKAIISKNENETVQDLLSYYSHHPRTLISSIWMDRILSVVVVLSAEFTTPLRYAHTNGMRSLLGWIESFLLSSSLAQNLRRLYGTQGANDGYGITGSGSK
ncbi:hypothetical protein LguiB_013582 [Lonicera macranthoides]